MENVAIEHDNDNNKDKISKKIFIPAIGSLGDVKPYLILAKELKKRGHVVWLGVHKRFEEQVKADGKYLIFFFIFTTVFFNITGIDTVEIGGDMEISLSTTPDGIELQRNPSIFKIGLVKRVILPLVEEWFNGILSGLKDADLVVLSFSSVLPGLGCIEKYPNMKAIGVYTFPAVRTSEFSPPALGGKSESLFNWINSLKWKMVEYGASSMYNDKMNQLRANINLPPIKINYDQMIRSILKRPMLTATIYSKCLLTPPSDWSENEFLVGPILQEENDDYQPSDDLLQFLNKWQNEKITYIGIGSMMSIMFNIDEQLQFLTNIQTVITNSNYKAVISLIGFQNIDDNKLSNHENIFYLKQSIPHAWLFPKMSAAIHHGGAGTTHTSLRYGLPTLILPFGGDQPFNGDRVFIKKLGPKPIPIRQMNVGNLNNAIEDLITNYTVYKNNAEKVGQLMKEENGLESCIQLIEKELIR
jgi:sterol 3beta-glucosyltransferase